MTVVLELDKVSKFYGEQVILKNVCCLLQSGTITLLTGNNGSGKSTLMRIMSGLTKPTQGRVQKFQKYQPGYVAHDTFLYPDLTAWENLVFWNKVYNTHLPDKTLLEWLERIELAAHAHERTRFFSRGMAQKLNLARAFMQPTDLLLLDEPGTGLDQKSLQMLRQELPVAKTRDTAIVIISHDLAGDAYLADKILVLRQGRLETFKGEACCA